MADMPWLKLRTDTLRSRMLRRQPLAVKVAWIAVLCFARESKVPGDLLIGNVPVTAEDIADEAEITEEEAQNALAWFVACDALEELESGAYRLTNWAKYQDRGPGAKSDAERQRLLRERRRSEAEPIPLDQSESLTERLISTHSWDDQAVIAKQLIQTYWSPEHLGEDWEERLMAIAVTQRSNKDFWHLVAQEAQKLSMSNRRIDKVGAYFAGIIRKKVQELWDAKTREYKQDLQQKRSDPLAQVAQLSAEQRAANILRMQDMIANIHQKEA